MKHQLAKSGFGALSLAFLAGGGFFAVIVVEGMASNSSKASSGLESYAANNSAGEESGAIHKPSEPMDTRSVAITNLVVENRTIVYTVWVTNIVTVANPNGDLVSIHQPEPPENLGTNSFNSPGQLATASGQIDSGSDSNAPQFSGQDNFENSQRVEAGEGLDDNAPDEDDADENDEVDSSIGAPSVAISPSPVSDSDWPELTKLQKKYQLSPETIQNANSALVQFRLAAKQLISVEDNLQVQQTKVTKLQEAAEVLLLEVLGLPAFTEWLSTKSESWLKD
jgi:hypothetical protein